MLLNYGLFEKEIVHFFHANPLCFQVFLCFFPNVWLQSTIIVFENTPELKTSPSIWLVLLKTWGIKFWIDREFIIAQK